MTQETQALLPRESGMSSGATSMREAADVWESRAENGVCSCRL